MEVIGLATAKNSVGGTKDGNSICRYSEWTNEWQLFYSNIIQYTTRTVH